MEVLLSPRADREDIVRVIAEDGLAVPKVWDRISGSWVEASPALLSKVPFWPEASPALLASLSIPDDPARRGTP